MRKTCLDMVYQLAREDPRIVFIGSDLGIHTLDAFKQEMPDRFFMEGVSEATVVGMATGFALDGKIPYINTISTFFYRRAFEQLVLDVALHKVPVRLIGNGGGLVYAPLGPTHLAFEDLAVLRAIPNLTIVAPCDADEMRRLMPLTVDYPGPLFIRLGKGHDPIVSRDHPPLEIGKALLIREGSEVLLISTGITLRIVLEAADRLSEHHIDTAILHVPTIKPLDSEQILQWCSQVHVVMTVEEHSIIGGLGSAVAELIAETSPPNQRQFKRMALPDAFPDDYGSQTSLMEHYNVSAEAIVKEVERLVHQSV